MHVTPHARLTAMYRVLRGQGVRAPGDGIAFHALDQAWERRCGLRRGDLTTSIAELLDAGALRQYPGPQGAVIEVTDRGSLRLQPRWPLFREFRWSQPLTGLRLVLHSAFTLFRARLRTRRFLRQSRTLVIDRRGRSEV